MNETPVAPAEPKKRNTGLIIAVVIVVLLCCCCVGGFGIYWLWNNGDQLLNSGLPALLHI